MTNIDKRIGRKIPDFVRREDSPGIRFDSGPYIGKIKNNLDTLRAGRLEVWIPDLGGQEDDPHYWRVVNYASPFFGSTNQQANDTNGSPSNSNDFKSVKHTYGMWFTPPDVGNFVICTFIAGDPMRGFWFACVPNQLGQHMVPAIAASKDIDSSKIQDSAAKGIYESGNPYPVVEFNENTQGKENKQGESSNSSDSSKSSKFENFVKAKKPVHEEQLKILGNQGLDKDLVRGVITSSSQRESPSAVFGISTPGRPLKDPEQPQKNEKKEDIKSNNLEVYGRKGGHTLVMDDGDYQGKNQLMRFRTAGGHQIMMNDSEEIVYIANSTGKVWLEMTGTGNLHVYSEESVSFRAKKGFNFHTEKDFVVHADGEIQLKAKKALSVETESTNLLSNKKTTIYGGDIAIGSQGKINLDTKNGGSFNAGGELVLYGSKIKLNSGKGPTVSKPKELKVNNFADAEKQGYKWKSKANKIKSITKIVPTHEPWPRPPSKKDTGASTAAPSQPSAAPSQVSGGGGVSNSSGAPDVVVAKPEVGNQGINDAAAKGVSRPVDPSYLNRSDNPTPSSGVGNLSPDEVKALKTQIAWSESGFKYDATEIKRGNYLGKYQIGAAALVDQRYIHPDAYAKYGTAAVQYPSSWTGKDGIGSKEAFLNNGSVQEKAMDNLLDSNYKTLVKYGGITSSDNSSTVAGMLSTSHLLGAGGAINWRKTGEGADANKTTGTTYFNQGRYAIALLSNNAGG